MTKRIRLTDRVTSSRRVPLLQAVKVAVATVLAWIITQSILPGQLPIFAAIAALLVVQPSVNQSVGKAIERSFGVIVGVLIAFGIAVIFGTNSWIVLLAIVVAIIVAWLMRLSPGTSNQVPISAMLVLSIGAATPDYAGARILETIIGAIIGVIINLVIVPPLLLTPANEAVRGLSEEVAATLDRLSSALMSPQTPQQLAELLLTSRLLRPMQAKARTELAAGEESLTFNPRQSKHRLAFEADEALFALLSPLVTRVIGMTRALHDRYDEELYMEPTVRLISTELSRASHDLRLFVDDQPGGTDAGVEEAALTAPLVISTPHPRHWILIGSLMEDLRRVREEIVGGPTL